MTKGNHGGHWNHSANTDAERLRPRISSKMFAEDFVVLDTLSYFFYLNPGISGGFRS